MPGFLCMFVHLSPPPRLLKAIHVKIANQTSPTAFHLYIIAIAIDVIDGWGLSN